MSNIAGVSDSTELSVLVVIEDDDSLGGVAQLFDLVCSGELGISSVHVGEVVEGGEVKEKSFLLVFELSWDGNDVTSIVGHVLDGMLS